MKRIFALLMIICLLFCSCSDVDETSSVEQPYPVTVGEITLLEQPDRVVSLSEWITKTLVELDLGKTLVGVSDYCVHATAQKMGIAENPDIEKIVTSNPDFVLVSQELSEQGREYLSKNNIPYYTFEKPQTFNEMVGLMCDLITIFEGKTDGLLRGQKTSADLISKAAAMKEIISQKEEKTFLYVQPDGFYLTGDTLLSDVFNTIGLENVAEEFNDYIIDEDSLKDLDPDIIFIDKSVDEEEFLETKPFNKMTDNIVKLNMSKLNVVSDDILDYLLDLVGGEQDLTSSEDTSSQTVSE